MTASTDPTSAPLLHHHGLASASDENQLKRAFSCFPSGVVAVCAHHPGHAATELVGMAASAFTSVSIDPPLVSVCVQNTSTTWPRLRDARRLGVSVFAEDQSAQCRQLAGPAAHRFDGITPLATDDGSLFIPGAAAHLACSIEHEMVAGDHILVLLRIRELEADPDVEPLVFHASTFRALAARGGREVADRAETS